MKSLALPRPQAKKLMILAFLTGVTGCAYPTYKAYNGLEKPKSEVATVYNSERSGFWSLTDISRVDNQRIMQPARAIAALPGVHWYQVVVTRRSKAALFFLQDFFYQEAVCGFILDGVPGSEYALGKVESGGLKSTKEHKIYSASLEIAERFADGSLARRHLPVECASFAVDAERPLCRRDEDCPSAGDACIREGAYAHGLCSKP